MRTSILFVLFSLSVFAQNEVHTKWTVRYNDTIVKQFVLGQNVDFNLKAAACRPEDYLVIEIKDENRCADCTYELNVVKEGKQTLYLLNTKNKFLPMKIPLKDIISEFKFRKSSNLFVVYFTEISKKGKRDSGMRLLTIKIQ
jgi:hypothetical protein